MAKELPYFKFEPAEYLTKDISFCSLGAQGLFINICAYYWQRNCKLTKNQLLKRLNHNKEFDELIDEGVIDLKENGQTIVIKFLDMQLLDVAKTSVQNSINGSKGGRPKKEKSNPKESENKPTALIPLSETKGIREDKIKEDEINNKKEDVDFLKLVDGYANEIGKGNSDKWIEGIYMSCKLKDKSLAKIVKMFNVHLMVETNGNWNKDFLEYRKHCGNWIRQQYQNGKLEAYTKDKPKGSL